MRVKGRNLEIILQLFTVDRILTDDLTTTNLVSNVRRNDEIRGGRPPNISAKGRARGHRGANIHRLDWREACPGACSHIATKKSLSWQ